MAFKIQNLKFILNRQKSGKTELEAKPAGLDFAGGDEKASACLKLEENEGCTLGRLSVRLKNEAFRENDNLAAADPVVLCMETGEMPKRMTALYLHRDWWTRPAFVKSWEELPERTQCVYLEYEDGYGCLMLLAGKRFKTNAGGMEPGKLCLNVTAYKGGQSELEEPVFIWAKKDSVYEAVHACAVAAAKETGAILKGQKEYPEMFDYLGWCSWDAFYTDISEEKVLAKGKELKEKQVPVHWMLLDDGWQSVREQRMYDLMPEKQKFPNGFAEMVRGLKDGSSVEHVGVWHALGGYWGGIEPGSRAHLEQKEHLYETSAGKLLPYPEAERGYGFYRDWYEELRREGIDFVKVDGQSAVKNYYENDIAVCEAAREAHKALEGATGCCMGGRLINCMGMAMENILGRQGSALARNSDDFVPNEPDQFREHLLQNVYNAVYHDEFYFCDWDMFWTYHPDAKKHALLRAVSGGPVYFSDRIGDTDAEAVRPLIYHDGQILRMTRTAMPAPECLFQNPIEGGLIKITNIGKYGSGNRMGGAVAVYNLGEEKQTAEISHKDIHDIPKGTYMVYDWKNRRVIKEGEQVELSGQDCGLYLVLPAGGAVTPVGLLDKYISFHALESVVETEHSLSVILKDGGIFGFFGQKPEKIWVDGEEKSKELEEKDGLWSVATNTVGKTSVMMVW
ncbi:MAG: Sip1-related alpha-galactosidase [Eisenbergiella sp.]